MHRYTGVLNASKPEGVLQVLGTEMDSVLGAPDYKLKIPWHMLLKASRSDQLHDSPELSLFLFFNFKVWNSNFKAGME